MARKKKETDVQTDPPPNGEAPEAAPAVTLLADAQHAEAQRQQTEQPRAAEAKQKPAVSWALNSDRTTRIECSAWINTVRTQQGDEFEQVSFTLSRNYRDQNDQWQRGGGWRTHDLPVLLFLLQKAHAWALERRTSDSSLPF